MSPIHDRMPAILPREAFSTWLDVDGVDATEAVSMLQPALESALELIPVGTAVNRVANDGEALQAPVGAPLRSRG
jgi:putative SOS response-associated peptidase YedK